MSERVTRYGIGALGVLAATYGLYGLWGLRARIEKLNFLEWLLGGILLNDIIIANVVALIGLVLAKTLPAHLRGFVQGALVVIALIGSFAFFVTWRQDTSYSPALALLSQDYLRNYAIVVLVVVLGTAALYAWSLRNIRKSRAE